MENTSKIVLGLIAAGLFILIGVNLQPNEVKKEEPIMVQAPVTNSTTQYLKDKFMSGCAEDPKDYVMCSCMFDTLYKKIGNDGIINMSAIYEKTGSLPEGTLPLVVECIK